MRPQPLDRRLMGEQQMHKQPLWRMLQCLRSMKTRFQRYPFSLWLLNHRNKQFDFWWAGLLSKCGLITFGDWTNMVSYHSCASCLKYVSIARWYMIFRGPWMTAVVRIQRVCNWFLLCNGFLAFISSQSPTSTAWTIDRHFRDTFHCCRFESKE